MFLGGWGGSLGLEGWLDWISEPVVEFDCLGLGFFGGDVDSDGLVRRVGLGE